MDVCRQSPSVTRIDEIAVCNFPASQKHCRDTSGFGCRLRPYRRKCGTFKEFRLNRTTSAASAKVRGAFHFALPSSKARKSETRHARRPCMRIGCIGPLPSQAHLLNVCGFRFIEAAAGVVGKTSGRSVFIAINSSKRRSTPTRDCVLWRVDGSSFK